MSNPGFGNNSETDLAWLAGLLQAEANFTADKRVRSKGNDPNYQPPPACPLIVVSMIEKDVMEKVGQMVDQTVVEQKRRTSANNKVYRVTIQAREKVESLLRAILPYTVGEAKRAKIQEMLTLCDDYNNWVASGGPRQQAAAAARARNAKRSAKNLTQDTTQ